jgi:hypothetical protein
MLVRRVEVLHSALLSFLKLVCQSWDSIARTLAWSISFCQRSSCLESDV